MIFEAAFHHLANREVPSSSSQSKDSPPEYSLMDSRRLMRFTDTKYKLKFRNYILPIVGHFWVREQDEHENSGLAMADEGSRYETLRGVLTPLSSSFRCSIRVEFQISHPSFHTWPSTHIENWSELGNIWIGGIRASEPGSIYRFTAREQSLNGGVRFARNLSWIIREYMIEWAGSLFDTPKWSVKE